jgi:serine/threonine-protein kinase
VAPEPTIFGRYQLLERIAKGGMAEVFKAKLVAAAGTEKVLCIKRILPVHSRNQEFISLFVREARIALSLTHGNVTQVFDFGEVDGVYYLAMEYISGQDLNTVLQRSREANVRLELPAVLYVAAEVCKGLQYAHGRQQPVVHRDVTPHNILISYGGEVKLADFGIALAATKVDSASREVVRGKACYLSPEQAAGEAGQPRSDIFSLGTVLYEMLTGKRPFEADGERETLDCVRTLEVEPPSAFNDEVDARLDGVVLKALAKGVSDRYGRAGELQVALTQILHSRWPDYTADRLADTMKDLFAWEIARADGEVGSDTQRDRLLFQLSRAGIPVQDRNATTAELLEMGTVAIPGAAAPNEGGTKRRPLLWFGGGVGLVGLAAVLLLSIWPMGTPETQPAPDSAPPAPRIAERHDHLEPPSMRRQRAELTSEPEPAPSTKKRERPARATKAARAKASRGYLNCNSWPWSVVYVDGRRLPGNTPLFRVKVAAGRHRIRFVNPELGLSREVSVTVQGGSTKTVAVSLQN